MSFFENTRKPPGLGGKIMIAMMNSGHNAMADWGLSQITTHPNMDVLDIGCGGGANIKKFLTLCPEGTVTGIDYSDISVAASQKHNAKAIQDGRCKVLQANVMNLPFEAQTFGLVTAFETVYFWPDLLQSFREVYRVLKPDGKFFICNESSGDTDKDNKWAEKIGGMTIYNDAQLKTVLTQAGFSDIHIHKNEKGWLCVIAEKIV